MSSSNQEYKKLTQLEHLLLRPDTYIGSVTPVEVDYYIYQNNELIKIEKFSELNLALIFSFPSPEFALLTESWILSLFCKNCNTLKKIVEIYLFLVKDLVYFFS